jgi:hypothetical protein
MCHRGRATVAAGRGDIQCLVDLGMLPIPDIPHLQKSAHEVLTMASLLLEHVRKAYASSASPWD